MQLVVLKESCASGNDLCPNFAPAETQNAKRTKSQRYRCFSSQQSHIGRQHKGKSRRRLPTLTDEVPLNVSRIFLESYLLTSFFQKTRKSRHREEEITGGRFAKCQRRGTVGNSG